MPPEQGDSRKFVADEIVFSSLSIRRATELQFGNLRHGVRCRWNGKTTDGRTGWTDCFPDIPNLSVICRDVDCFAFVGPALTIPALDRGDVELPVETGLELLAAVVMFFLGGCLCSVGFCVALYHIRHLLIRVFRSYGGSLSTDCI